jgi:nucleoid-associated protein YgaU
MRCARICGGGAFVLWLAACSDGRAESRVGEGKLVLELGGSHASLRQSLARAGIELPAAQRVTVPGQPDQPPATPDAPASDGAAAPSPPKPADDGPAPAPSPQEPFVYVTLGERQTLIHIARKYLGDANRFREIVELNGWSEADTRRLKTGQRVKIPRPTNAASRGR